MKVPLHCWWIDNRCMPRRGRITHEFYAGVDEFVQLACAQESFIRLGVLKCFCMKCECLKFKSVNKMKMDLCKHGFMKNVLLLDEPWGIHASNASKCYCK